MLNIKSRNVFLGLFLVTSGLIAYALYLQYYQNLAPCPLCMLQRVIYIAIAVVSLLAYWHNPRVKGMRNYALVNTILVLAGLGLAGRQIWLESLPPELVPACGPSLDVLLQYLPLFEALKVAIKGSGDCAKINWALYGLSIASWSFISFLGILLVNLKTLFRPIGRF